MKKQVLAFLIFLLLSPSAFAQGEDGASETKSDRVSYSELRKLIDDGQVVDAIIWDDGWWVSGRLSNGDLFEAAVNPNTFVADRLVDAGVPTRFVRHAAEDDDESSYFFSMFLNILPLLIFLGFFAFVMFALKGPRQKAEARADRTVALLESTERKLSEILTRLEKTETGGTSSNG